MDYVIPKEYNKIRGNLLGEFKCYLTSEVSINLTSKRLVLIERALSCFLLNTVYQVQNKQTRVPITLDSNSYNSTFILNGRDTGRKVSYTYTKHLIRFLISCGFIEIDKGGVTEYVMVSEDKYVPKASDNTYVVVQDKLVMLYNTIEMVTPDRVNVILLRDDSKKCKPFQITPVVKEKKELIQDYNIFAIKHIATVDGVHYDIRLHKIFNGSLFSGGRSYMKGSIQTLSKDKRKRVLINDLPCVCYDYQGFEVSILYTLANEVLEADPYFIQVQGYDKDTLRSIAKKVMMCLINCKTLAGAKQAVVKVLKLEFDIKSLYKRKLIPHEYIHTDIIVDKLLERHKSIKKLLFCNNAIDLQYIGSHMNDYILGHMINKYKCLVLQIHDAFIVTKKFEKEIQQCMFDAYEHVLGLNSNCRITKEF